MPRPGGFTLLELLVVLFIAALAAGLALQSLPDARQTALAREADRLSALLEIARAKARSQGLTARFIPTKTGFVFTQIEDMPQHWLNAATRAEGTLLLGPEPITPAQRVTLTLDGATLVLASDGVRAFAPQATPAP